MVQKGMYLVLIPHPQPVEQFPNGAHCDHDPPPWQSAGWHGFDCRLSPAHSSPPYLGEGLLHVLARN